jgi:hypothetical protein
MPAGNCLPRLHTCFLRGGALLARTTMRTCQRSINLFQCSMRQSLGTYRQGRSGHGALTCSSADPQELDLWQAEG